MALEHAADALADGEPVLLYDRDGREEETDVVFAAETVDWQAIRFLRNEAGGLVCTAIPHDAADRFDLPLLEEMFDGFGGAPDYDDRSSFSITVNHASTYTGVTDRDRATTIRKVAEAVDEGSAAFRDEFRSPGHVPLLVAAEDLLVERQGHTEMSLVLAEAAGVTPAAVVCEMLDDDTGRALPKQEAMQYAEENGLVFLDGEEMADR